MSSDCPDLALLSRINSPEDIKKLEKAQLGQLSDELRTFMIRTISKTGGHLASSLGTVELTVALALCVRYSTGSVGVGCRASSVRTQDPDRAP